MCGIAGIVSQKFDIKPDWIQKMTESLKHRGPDSGNTFIENQIALGQRRLSIIDLSSNADQPFFDLTGRYAIVFNGEIYNYESVRKRIAYTWQTSSDTEVILAAFIQYGEKCLEMFNGMFAFAIWDRKEKELFMARDRIGVKPFYYFESDSYFIFSSEIRSILNTGLVERKINTSALVGYLSCMAAKTPASIIHDINQIEPGQYAIWKKGKIEKKSYWMLLKGDNINKSFSLSYPQCVTQTRQLFEEAVKSRMVADVSVGAFLSGGIDSSAIVAMMSELSKKPIETFSIVFNEKQFDESEYARIIAKKYATRHTELLLKPEEIIQNLPEYLSKMDSPTVDGINTYMVSKMVAAKGLKVALSGLGGDELFAGYNGFRRWSFFNKHRFLLKNMVTRYSVNAAAQLNSGRTLAKLNDFCGRPGSGLISFYGNSRSIFLAKELVGLLTLEDEADSAAWFELEGDDIHKYPLYSQYTIAELTNYTLDVLLKDTDQMSMAWGLEIREPFFDYHLIEFLLSVPDKFKNSSKTPKGLFIDAMGEMLPRSIVDRPKKGFSFPWDSWIRKELRDYCDYSIHQLAGRGIFNNEKLLSIWNNFIACKKGITWMHIWSLVILERWLSINIDQEIKEKLQPDKYK